MAKSGSLLHSQMWKEPSTAKAEMFCLNSWILLHEGVEVFQVSVILVSYKTLTAQVKAGQFAIVLLGSGCTYCSCLCFAHQCWLQGGQSPISPYPWSPC